MVISIPDFIDQYKLIIENPQAVFPEKDFKTIDSVIHVRNIIENSNLFLFLINNGIPRAIRLDGSDYPLTRTIKNKLIELFKEHNFIVFDHIFEIAITESGNIIFNDIFSLTNYNDGGCFQFEASHKRLGLILKLFRETKYIPEISFNVPSITSPSGVLERHRRELNKIDMFPFFSSYKIVVRLNENDSN